MKKRVIGIGFAVCTLFSADSGDQLEEKTSRGVPCAAPKPPLPTRVKVVSVSQPTRGVVSLAVSEPDSGIGREPVVGETKLEQLRGFPIPAPVPESVRRKRMPGSPLRVGLCAAVRDDLTVRCDSPEPPTEPDVSVLTQNITAIHAVLDGLEGRLYALEKKMSALDEQLLSSVAVANTQRRGLPADPSPRDARADKARRFTNEKHHPILK